MIRMRFIVTLAIIGLISIVSCSKNNSVVPDLKIPELTTTSISSIMLTTAQSGGTITSDGGATITERGICWSTETSPNYDDSKVTSGNGSGTFTSSLSGLTKETKYYVRAFAKNEMGIGYGNEISFTTRGTVTDIDGNEYQTIKIGNQWWMAENLKVTTYRSGYLIPEDDYMSFDWTTRTDGAYCCYFSMSAESLICSYGNLYNWYAVADSRGLAPSGWHIPSYTDWQILFNYLGGVSVAGGKMKTTGTSHWSNPNTGATNESGFSALPCGHRQFDDGFSLGDSLYTIFWSSTQYNDQTAICIKLSYDSPGVGIYQTDKNEGCYIRCVKNN